MPTVPRNRIPVDTIPEDEQLLIQYARAARALIAVLGPIAGKCEELETLKVVEKRARPRISQLEGEESGS